MKIMVGVLGAGVFDQLATDAAVGLADEMEAEVVACSVGGQTAESAVFAALARGADRGIWIEAKEPDPAWIARALYALMANEDPQLILLGSREADDCLGHVGPRLAGLAGLPMAGRARTIELNAQRDRACVVREVENGVETLELVLPALVTVSTSFGSPRLLGLQDIVQARGKLLKRVPALELGLPACVPQVQTRSVVFGRRPRLGRKVNNASELVSALREEARVIP
jgi:electron transfer flavoprotein beta subunit